MAPRVIAIIATVDTKGAEAYFLRDWFRTRGYEARVVDVGTGRDPRFPPDLADVRWEAVAEAGEASPAALGAMRRDAVMAAMGRGAGVVLRPWLEQGRLAGVIGIGGHQGTTIAGLAMGMLPLGVPRVLVSTVASGNVRPFLGCGDAAIVSSVGDLLGGPNRVTRPILVRAAGMLVGMIEAATPAGAVGDAARASPAVAVTALGNTHAAVTRVMADLGARGYEVIPFHASGAGGSAMEGLVRRGQFAAVIDLTPHEFLGEVLGDDIYAPVEAGRLTAAGAAGIPQIVAPGGLDYFVFGAAETVPERYRGRPTHYHNPYNTNVRASAEELRRLGQALAERLNGARGPVAVLIPLRGWSHIGREGGPLWDPQANDALREAVRRSLRTDLRYIEVDAAINDSPFADKVAAVACEFLGARSGTTRARTEGGVPCS